MLFLKEHVIFLSLIVTICLLLYFYFTRNFNHWKNKNVPFAPPIPIFGNVMNGVLLRQPIGETFHELYKKTIEPVLGIFVIDKPCVLIRDPEIIKKICVGDFKNFNDRSVVNNKKADPISTHILFFLKNPDWKDVRAKINPIFTPSKIKALSPLIQKSVDKMVNYINNRVDENSTVDMSNVSKKYTVDVITSTVCGVDEDCFDDQSQFWIEANRIADCDNIFTAFRMRSYFLCEPIVNTFKIAAFDPVSLRFFKESFWGIVEERSASSHRRNDLIDVLIHMKNEDKHFIGGDVLVSQVVMFHTAGAITSSSTMIFAILELALHPEVQTKLRNEINVVADKYGGVNYDSLNKMKYLDMCVKEVLRKHPAAPFLERNCNSDYVISETGTIIDKGTSVLVSILGLHYDPQYFPDPEKFDPERFAPDSEHNIKSFTYLPFGEGPRNCIGEKYGLLVVKYGLANIVKKFTFEPRQDIPAEIRYHPKGILLIPATGIKLHVKRN